MATKRQCSRLPALSQESSLFDADDIQRHDYPFDVHTIEELGGHRASGFKTPCRPESFEIIWITRGIAHLGVDKQEVLLDNGRLCLLAPGRVQHLVVKGPAQGYLISFSTAFLYMGGTPNNFFFWLDVCNDGFSLPIFRGQQGDLDEMEDLLLKIKKEFEREGPTSVDLLNGLFNVFTVYFSRNYYLDIPKISSSRDKFIAKKYLSLVKKNFRTKKAVSDYAGELAVSPNYLTQVVKRVSGFPPRYHIQQSIVSYAKNQAIYSNLSLKEIAGSLGFDDYAHFSKFFKNFSGMKFSNFRNAMGRV